MADVSLRDIFSDAIRYRERRRIIYNGILLAVVPIVFMQAWPDLKNALSFDTAQKLFVLAVFANVFYCTEYIVDGFVLYSEFRQVWLRFRSALFIIGVLFAVIFANNVAQSIVHQ